jgi:Domain of Unknown Function (DUF1080)
MMTNPNRMFPMVATALLLGVTALACTTAATGDPPPGPVTGTGGQSSSGTGGSGSGGAGASVGAGGSGGTGIGDTGGSTGAGGSTGGSPTGAAGTTGSGGVTGTGGSTGVAGSTGAGGSGGSKVGTGGSGATGGAVGTGGAVATGGAVGTGGVAATGCNWVHDTTTDLWSFATPAPASKIVLFDGTTLSGWHTEAGGPVGWLLVGDGSMQVVTSGTGQATEIQSNMKFNDLCVHVEYLTPVFPSTTTDVQKQGNSGVYLKSAYEMQILDTHNSPPLIDGCGAVYKVSPPLVVACYQYLIWNTYEIEFKGSVWDTSSPPKKTKDAVYVRVALNGKLVQMNVDLNPPGGFTQAGLPDAAGPQSLGLQDHLDKVSFRNIWATVPQY